MNKLLFILFISLIFSSAFGQKFPSMVIVKGGSFEMGNNEGLPNERPAHTVIISSFKMSKYEVTVGEFAAFVAATGYKTDAEKLGTSIIFYNDSVKNYNDSFEWYWQPGVTWRDDEMGHPRDKSQWNMPVTYVSWNDAAAYCMWLSQVTGKAYHLPTEAQWEYAAGNAARHTKYSWGNDLPGKGKPVANVRDEHLHPRFGSWAGRKYTGYDDGYFFASPVGSYPPNELGLYDMTGNVWEWCNDIYRESHYPDGPVTDPQGPQEGWMRVFRGGSWHSKPENCLVTVRRSGAPNNRTANLGFRVVSSL